MTAIFYPDCEATSPGGRYTLEARSPHNGTIPHRDGSPATDEELEYRSLAHQDEFRYRLVDNTRRSLLARALGREPGTVMWERWQERGEEDSPHEVVVSDEGWSILRTHGFRPEVIAVSPEGREAIRVEIEGLDDCDETDRKLRRETSHLWRAVHFQDTTAGAYWTLHSWRYFFSVNRRSCFAWRTSWGQRLVLDLNHSALLGEEAQQDPRMQLVMREAETQGALSLLSDLAGQTEEIQQRLAQWREEPDSDTHDPLMVKLSDATAAIHLVGVHRAATCVPLLRRLELIDSPSYSTGSSAMSDWWLEAQQFRPILHHTLRLLGEEPQGYAPFHFVSEVGRRSRSARFSIPEHVRDRRERAAELNLDMDAKQVLRRLGAPDHVRRDSHKAADRYGWMEAWEYDFRVVDRWVTLRITWEEGDGKGRIVRFEEMPAPWMTSDQREADLLLL